MGLNDGVEVDLSQRRVESHCAPLRAEGWAEMLLTGKGCSSLLSISSHREIRESRVNEESEATVGSVEIR